MSAGPEATKSCVDLLDMIVWCFRPAGGAVAHIKLREACFFRYRHAPGKVKQILKLFVTVQVQSRLTVRYPAALRPAWRRLRKQPLSPEAWWVLLKSGFRACCLPSGPR